MTFRYQNKVIVEKTAKSIAQHFVWKNYLKFKIFISSYLNLKTYT